LSIATEIRAIPAAPKDGAISAAVVRTTGASGVASADLGADSATTTAGTASAETGFR
jgi:hypothetical protein